jgi:hypothetical protein
VALIDFQTALGCLVRGDHRADRLEPVGLDDQERASLAALTQTAGFRVTVAIQRSWCEGRAARGAALTLSFVPEQMRQQLLDEWVSTGGGTNSFFEAEADAFCEFLSTRLDDFPEALQACRIERATLRAHAHADRFELPSGACLDDERCVVCASRFASFVRCDSEPKLLLFAPGLRGLWRPASDAEAELWGMLSTPFRVQHLVQMGHSRRTIEDLFSVGAIEIAQTAT